MSIQQQFTRQEVERIICETIYRTDAWAIWGMRISGTLPEYDDIINTALDADHWMST